MRTTGTRMLGAVAVLALGAGLTACDGDDPLDVNDDVDVYAAELAPLNGSDVQAVTAVQVSEDDDVFFAEVEAVGLAVGETHPQHIHAGADCPTTAADADGDGLIEISEGADAYGTPLIPLDDDLADPGINTFPTGAAIDYGESVGLATLRAHIPADEQPLDLATRTVVLHGAWVLDDEIVVAGTAGAEYRATLPVACGTLVVFD